MWIASIGSALDTGQSLPAASRAPCAHEVAERVLPGLGAVLQEGQGELVDLVLVGGPERLDVRDGAELGEPGGLGLLDDLQVREVVPAVGRAVGRAGRVERVERLAHRAVAERVEVHLESGGVEGGHVAAAAAPGRRTRVRGCAVSCPCASR